MSLALSRGELPSVKKRTSGAGGIPANMRA
jgi:hypothetical protein